MEAQAYHMTTSGAGSNEVESRIRVREDRTIALRRPPHRAAY